MLNLSRAILLFCLCVALLFTSQVVPAITPAGTLIENKATVVYTDEATGLVLSASTNIARVRVAELRSVLLTQDLQLPVLAGLPVTLPHRLFNAGNVADSYRLSVRNLEEDAGDLHALGIFHDLNANGVLDAGEPELQETGELQPEGEIALLISARLPAKVRNGDRLRLRLDAQSLGDELSVSNDDELTLIEGAYLQLTKSNAPNCNQTVDPGALIHYTLKFSNVGDLVPATRAVIVAGEVHQGVLIEDEIAPNTELSLDAPLRRAPAQGMPLVLTREGYASNNWTPLQAWNGVDSVLHVGLLLSADSLAPDHSGKLEYGVRVLQQATTGTRMTAKAEIDLDGDGVAEFASAELCNQVGGEHQAQLRFLQPVASLRATAKAPEFAIDDDFEDAGYYRLDTDDFSYEAVRDGVYLELRASGFNRSSLIADGEDGSIVIRVRETGTDDYVLLVMRETGPNTGVFRSIRPLVLHETVTAQGTQCPPSEPFDPQYSNDELAGCVLHSDLSGSLQASISDPLAGVTVEDAALVEPMGMVFDSRTLQPLAGARVRIRNIDGSVALDPLTGGADPLPAQQTGNDGRYRFPGMFPGQYYLDVEAPEYYEFPSVVAPQALPGKIVMTASYGKDGFARVAGSGVFSLLAGGAPLVMDVPLDNAIPFPLTLEKSAQQGSVEIGSVIAYRVRVHNGSTLHTRNLFVQDRLPYGFKYVPGSTRVGGVAAGDPQGGAGPELRFELGDLDANAERELSYVLQATAGALDSDGINTAQAFAELATGLPVASAQVRARVKVERRGILSDRAIVFGKVFVDADCDGEQDTDELPVGGVKLYLQDGTYVISDEYGQYSLYGLIPGQHVLKVDALSLPAGAQLAPISNRHAGSGDSRFVDLRGGDFHRADFAIACSDAPRADLLALIRTRNADINGNWMLDEAASLQTAAPQSAAQPQPGGDGDVSNGLIQGGAGEPALMGAPAGFSGFTLQLAAYPDLATAEQALSRLPERVRGQAYPQASEEEVLLRVGFAPDRESLMPLKSTLEAAGHAPHIVSSYLEQVPLSKALLFTDAVNEAMPLAQEIAKQLTRDQGSAGTWFWPRGERSLDGRFMVGVRAGVEPTLYLNGQAVAQDRLGERIVNTREQAQVLAWYGLVLEEGENRVQVKAMDPFGNERVLAEGVFRHPAGGVRLRLVSDADELAADGGRSALRVELLIEDRHGYAAGGIHYVTLESDGGRWLEPDLQPTQPGHQIKVSNGRGRAHLLSGNSTGPVHIRASSGTLVADTRITQVAAPRPLLANGLLELSTRRNRLSSGAQAPTAQADGMDQAHAVDARAALFMKGAVKGGMQLTLAYDSDKEDDAELFRDIDPASSYPIHGDAGVRGYEAQSRSRLYAKLERGLSSLMWGDYLSDAHSELQLQRMQRALTGVNGQLQLGATRVSGFSAHSSDSRVTEELRGQGTALNYRLNAAPIVRNSERLELIVRDRENPGLVISREPLTRFGDYQLDPLTGQLQFFRPIPSLDAGFNPVYVAASYEVEGDAAEHQVAGVRVETALSESLRAGVSYSHDGSPTEGSQVRGAHLAYQPSPDMRVHAEAASMRHADGAEAGDAYLLQAERTWSNGGRSALTWARAQAGFDNSQSSIAAGRSEQRLQHQQPLREDLEWSVEAVNSRSLQSTDIQRSLGTHLDWRVGDWRLRAGARHLGQETDSNDEAFTTGLAGADRAFELFGRNVRLGAELEQDLSGADRRALRLQGDVQVHEKSRLYGRYEYLTSATGVGALNTEEARHNLAVGSETQWLPSTQTYNEYRMSGGIDGRDLATASGVRANLELRPGLTITPNLEVVNALAGDDSGEGVAASVAINDVRDENSRKSLQAELRHGAQADYYGVRGSYASRLNEDWTGVVREQLTVSRPDDAAQSLEHELTLGLARRPRANNTHHMLFLYQWKEQRGAGEADDRSMHLLSTHQNLAINQATTLSARLGAKWEQLQLSGGTFDTATAVADARLLIDLNPKWDLDLHGGVLLTDGGKGRRHAAGIGLNYQLRKDLRVGVGYNFAGFREEDLDPQGYNARGLYFGVQMKFDEGALQWLGE